MIGGFEEPVIWPPVDMTRLTMEDWAIEREGQADKSRSCLGESEEGDVFELVIDVTSCFSNPTVGSCDGLN